MQTDDFRARSELLPSESLRLELEGCPVASMPAIDFHRTSPRWAASRLGRGPRYYGEMPAEAKPVAVTGGLEVRKAASKDGSTGIVRHVQIV